MGHNREHPQPAALWRVWELTPTPPSYIQLQQCVLEWVSSLHEQQSAWAAGVAQSAVRVQWFLWH